eukprot:TRINITY_DN50714_c0_g1_i1.p1 TRINITY_DN50714_c0_g1~~TRINITY_DN50714_c0_g1_i1.p1  ORF type:complete len:568 (+),score=164.50 TRINITY_DN50714_c0_g1_i1:73-1704(+)
MDHNNLALEIASIPDSIHRSSAHASSPGDQVGHTVQRSTSANGTRRDAPPLSSTNRQHCQEDDSRRWGFDVQSSLNAPESDNGFHTPDECFAWLPRGPSSLRKRPASGFGDARAESAAGLPGFPAKQPHQWRPLHLLCGLVLRLLALQAVTATVLWGILAAAGGRLPTSTEPAESTPVRVTTDAVTRLFLLVAYAGSWSRAAGMGLAICASGAAAYGVAVPVWRGTRPPAGPDALLWARGQLAADLLFAAALLAVLFALFHRRGRAEAEGFSPLAAAGLVVLPLLVGDLCAAAARLAVYEWAVPAGEERRWQVRAGLVAVYLAAGAAVRWLSFRMGALPSADAVLWVLPLVSAPAFAANSVAFTMPLAHHAAFTVAVSVLFAAFTTLPTGGMFSAPADLPVLPDGLTRADFQRSFDILMHTCVDSTQFVHAAVGCSFLQFREGTEFVQYGRVVAAVAIHLTANVFTFLVNTWVLHAQGVPPHGSYAAVRQAMRASTRSLAALCAPGLGLFAAGSCHYLLLYHLLDSLRPAAPDGDPPLDTPLG